MANEAEELVPSNALVLPLNVATRAPAALMPAARKLLLTLKTLVLLARVVPAKKTHRSASTRRIETDRATGRRQNRIAPRLMPKFQKWVKLFGRERESLFLLRGRGFVLQPMLDEFPPVNVQQRPQREHTEDGQTEDDITGKGMINLHGRVAPEPLRH